MFFLSQMAQRQDADQQLSQHEQRLQEEQEEEQIENLQNEFEQKLLRLEKRQADQRQQLLREARQMLQKEQCLMTWQLKRIVRLQKFLDEHSPVNENHRHSLQTLQEHNLLLILQSFNWLEAFHLNLLQAILLIAV
jgi:hypothetical protein